MNPTPDALAAIRSQVATLTGGFAGNSNERLSSALNDATLANPTPQGTQPGTINWATLMALLSPASLSNLRASPLLPRILDDVNGANRPAVLGWINLLSSSPAQITVAEASALTDAVNAQQPDPTWPPLVSWAEIHLGRAADIDDIQAARST